VFHLLLSFASLLKDLPLGTGVFTLHSIYR
jgi:hypothetical protein